MGEISCTEAEDNFNLTLVGLEGITVGWVVLCQRGIYYTGGRKSYSGLEMGVKLITGKFTRNSRGINKTSRRRENKEEEAQKRFCS